MSTSAPDGRAFPRGPLLGAAALIAIALASAAAGRHLGVTGTAPDEAAAVSVRSLRFEDRPDGGVTILDASDGRQVDVAAAGTNGFLRATLRGLARERRLRGVTAGAEAPFRVSAWADGRVTLDDPATGRRLELAAFGQTNEAAFARLLATPTDGGTP